jgi:hypothetical protein
MPDTDPEVWLRRAGCFARFAAEHVDDPDYMRIPDRPLSLFEGKSGYLLFLLAMMSDDPIGANFPMYTD